MTDLFNLRITPEMLNNFSAIGTAFGYLQGAGNCVPPDEKANNHIENIHALLVLRHPHITQEQVRAAYFDEDLMCIGRELAKVRNFVKAYRFAILSLSTTESLIDDFLKINEILKLDATAYSEIKCALNPSQKEIIGNLSGLLNDKKFHRYIQSAALYKKYSKEKFFAEFNEESWIFLSLLILFKGEHALSDFPLKNLIESMVKNRTGQFEVLLLSMLDELYEISYPLAIEIFNKRQAVTDQIKSKQVRKLLSVMEEGKAVSAKELMSKLQFEDASSFRKNYMTPAVKSRFIEKCLPQSTSPNQAYILTSKGVEFMQKQ